MSSAAATTEVQRSFYPTPDSSAIAWGVESVSDHTVKLSISVDYRLIAVPKSQDEINRKYYITYSLGGHVEGKSEILATGEQKWFLQQEILVNKELILNLYQNPSEIVLWEITTIAKEARKKKKDLEEVAQAKRKATGQKSSNAIQMSLANTGLVKKRLKLKTQGKFIPAQVMNKQDTTTTTEEEGKEDLDEDLNVDPLLLRKRSSSSPNLGSDSEEWKKRPGSGSSILSRPASSSYATIESYTGPSGNSRTFPHPHHYDHPEKHMDGSLIRTGLVRSRSSSLTNIMRADRPRTPPSPHHHTHPLKTIRKDSPKGSKSVKTKNNGVDEKKAGSPPSKKANVRWGSASPNTAAHEDQGLLHHSWRLENDHQILRGQPHTLVEKKKGDSLHSPLERAIFDISLFFLEILDIRGSIHSCRKQLSDCRFSFSLDAPLLSQEQKAILNPIVVTLGLAEGMPGKPIPFKVLDAVSHPIYATFKFFADPFYHTAVLRQNHEKTLNFQSKHVILPGLLDSKKLLDDIRQKKLLIEIHDRDYKYSKEDAEKHSKFFEGGVIQSNLNPQSPYGQAYFDLRDIGTRKTYETTILPSPRVEKHLAKGSLLQGDYFTESSIFAISVEAQNPLKALDVNSNSPLYSSISIYCKNDVGCVKSILDYLRDYNFKTLNLDLTDGLQKENVLISFAITKENEKLDILHGYHIFDAENHFLFIEGKDLCITSLEDYLNNLHPSYDCFFSRNDSVFYRQKPLTSPNLMHLQLEPKISNVCSWTKSSVIVNRNYESINILNAMIAARPQSWKRDAFPFPSQKRILPLLKGFAAVKTGTEVQHILERKVQEIEKDAKIEKQESKQDAEPEMVSATRKATGKRNAVHKIDSANIKHNNLLKFRKNREPNFIAINSKRHFAYTPSMQASTNIRVFNYSIQKHSSTQNQIQELRSKLQKDKSKILAFASGYLSSIPLAFGDH